MCAVESDKTPRELRVAVTSQIGFLGLPFTVIGLLGDGLYALVAGTAGRWIKRQGHYLRWERYLTGGVFIGQGLMAICPPLRATGVNTWGSISDRHGIAEATCVDGQTTQIVEHILSST
jgi:hypothetical protein